jgi:hypothetical protein
MSSPSVKRPIGIPLEVDTYYSLILAECLTFAKLYYKFERGFDKFKQWRKERLLKLFSKA